MDRLPLFPDTASITDKGLAIAGCDLAALAAEHGTPLYLYDQATLDGAAGRYRQALARHYPAESAITYAGKAYLCTAIAQWTRQQGLWLDCTGQGELAIAAAAGLPPERLVVHGVYKSPDDLAAALQHAGTLVVDNLAELERLVALSAGRRLPELWLRFQPGVAVATHAHIQTGQSGSKFGMERQDLLHAARLCRQHNLPLKGIHFHLGSQFRDPAPLGPAILSSLDLAVELGFEADWRLSPGGGWGVAYHEDELPQPDLEGYIRFIAGTVVSGCRQRGLPLPRLQLEPGRSLVARAGVAVYRLGALKRSAGRAWALLDGGLADNPRPALYGAHYSALLVSRPTAANEEPLCLAGPYCESGDVLALELPLPEVAAGELIAVPVSGAYQLSMAGNYNGACRPAVLWLSDGQARLIQRRETPEDLLRRDRPLE
ncbi:MAG TPA: diaminopimelate decarboxylase [Anaerolineales bacterium]|nr:diaminopimelate decarboxylase [Anaerolineales bacterium]